MFYREQSSTHARRVFADIYAHITYAGFSLRISERSDKLQTLSIVAVCANISWLVYMIEWNDWMSRSRMIC